MKHLRNVGLAFAALAFTASAAIAQRTVNTGSSQASGRAWEVGFDAASVTLGLDDPQYLAIQISDPFVRFAMFFSPNMAIEPRVSWYSAAQKNRTGTSFYALDVGVIYGLTSLEPSERGMYVRPSVMISGGSGGTRSLTTLSGAFGMRRQVHAIIMHNEISLNRQLESGPLAAATYIELRHGISLRR